MHALLLALFAIVLELVHDEPLTSDEPLIYVEPAPPPPLGTPASGEVRHAEL